MGFHVENPGILTTIQDSGRYGYEKFGISPSGPMDFVSFTLANILAGNSFNEACLELTISGASLRFDSECVIAVTGTDMNAQINGRPCEMYRAIKINAGDVLALGFAKNYCRTYIAFHGGLDVPVIMGSRSAAIQNHIGKKLQKGDYIQIRRDDNPVKNLDSRFIMPPANVTGERILRVILGPQNDSFTEKGINDFLTQPYRVSSDFNRMGYRLEGAKIEHVNDCNIISDGMTTGAIQIPGSGQPIIMMSERQTIGGYTKIASVITADLPVVGQCREGDVLRFKSVSLNEAHEALREIHDNFIALQNRLNDSVSPNESHDNFACIHERANDSVSQNESREQIHDSFTGIHERVNDSVSQNESRNSFTGIHDRLNDSSMQNYRVKVDGKIYHVSIEKL